MNVFQFKHVGKGLFYAGSVNDDINFVYDCGTADNKEALDFEISSLKFIFDSPNIDFVIISNLSSAYFNGLPELCENFNVNKLYLPYLGKNKEFIRYALADTIFYGMRNADCDEQLRLYCFMCNLYGIESGMSYGYRFAMPDEVVMLGANDNGAAEISFDNTYAIRKFPEAADNTLWKFFIINKCVKQEYFDGVTERFAEVFRNVGSKGKKANGDSFEKYLFKLIKTDAEKFHKDMTEIKGDKKNKIRLSSNILVHYPQSFIGNMYLGEYKNVGESYLQSMQVRIEGKITVLLGDTHIDKKLEQQIFSCGNFSFDGAILQIPYDMIADNRPDIISIARTFKTFVSAVNTGETDRIINRAVIKQITYPNKPLHITTPSTGVIYFFG